MRAWAFQIAIARRESWRVGGQTVTWQDSWVTAFRGLARHRLRAGLTLVGLVAGIATIIVLVAIGQGVGRGGRIMAGNAVSEDRKWASRLERISPYHGRVRMSRSVWLADLTGSGWVIPGLAKDHDERGRRGVRNEVSRKGRYHDESKCYSYRTIAASRASHKDGGRHLKRWSRCRTGNRLKPSSH